MLTRSIILLLSLLAFSFSLSASEQALVVYTEEFPPYNFSVNNQITGINVELVQAACDATQIQCIFEIYPWNRALKNALVGPNTALVSTARTAERETMFKWVGPFMSGQNCIYKLANRTDIDIPNIAAASKYQMGASTDSAYKEILKNIGFEEGKNLKLYQGKYSKVRPFSAHRVDLIVGSATSIQVQLAHGDLKLADVVPVAVINNKLLNGNYLALHPAIDDDVVGKLQTAVDSLIASGMASQFELDFVKPISLRPPPGVSESLWSACMREDTKLVTSSVEA